MARTISRIDARFVAKLMRRPLLAPASDTTSSLPGPSRASAVLTRSVSGVSWDAGMTEGGGGTERSENT